MILTPFKYIYYFLGAGAWSVCWCHMAMKCERTSSGKYVLSLLMTYEIIL